MWLLWKMGNEAAVNFIQHSSVLCTGCVVRCKTPPPTDSNNYCDWKQKYTITDGWHELKEHSFIMLTILPFVLKRVLALCTLLMSLFIFVNAKESWVGTRLNCYITPFPQRTTSTDVITYLEELISSSKRKVQLTSFFLLMTRKPYVSEPSVCPDLAASKQCSYLWYLCHRDIMLL